MSITVTRVRHSWPEAAGFTINRPKGIDSYTFLYFHNSVELLVRGKILVTQPGSCIIFHPDTPQWFCSREALKHDWMHMTGPVEEALTQTGLQADTLYIPKNGYFITDLVRKIEQEHFSKPAGYQLMQELKVQELFLKLTRSCCQQSQQNRLKPAMTKQLQSVRSTVFSRLSEDWSVGKMAKLCYLSPSRFHTIYKSCFGISPTEDLIQARMENAKNRLSGGQDTVREIAEGLGYRNVTHFCRQFKGITGKTPMEYRSEAE